MDKGPVKRLGCFVSEKVANFAGDPLAQIGLLVVCAGWFYSGLPVEILTAGLSILAITLTQMVLNPQNEREGDTHRRDLALHAKIDELVHAAKRARDEIAGIENLEEEEIEALRDGFGSVEVSSIRKSSGDTAVQDKGSPGAPKASA